ncbi:MAG TPA: hypothetical protein PKZ16_02140 [bacterium]|nr:hypothetical protein [bacterium]HPL95633.1 hypothetical protein [bacterium]
MFRPQKITTHSRPNQKNANQQKNKRRKKTAVIRSATIKIDPRKIDPASIKASRARLVKLIPPPFEPENPEETWLNFSEEFSTEIRELAWAIKEQKNSNQQKRSVDRFIRKKLTELSRMPHNGKTRAQKIIDLFHQNKINIDPQKNFADILPFILKLTE